MENISSAFGTVFADDSTLEIANASFSNNDVDYPSRERYPEDVGFQGEGQLSLYNSYSNRGQYSVFAPYTGGVTAAERVEAFAVSLGATIPLGGDWWRGSTSGFQVLADGGAIDPGRHYAAPSSWE